MPMHIGMNLCQLAAVPMAPLVHDEAVAHPEKPTTAKAVGIGG